MCRIYSKKFKFSFQIFYDLFIIHIRRRGKDFFSLSIFNSYTSFINDIKNKTSSFLLLLNATDRFLSHLEEKTVQYIIMLT